jgi:acyl-CoA synthetase (AMP-forming)/AMP-acid ligase II
MPEMNNYGAGTAVDPIPKGEAKLRGPSIMRGDFKTPDKEAETVNDGWLLGAEVGPEYIEIGMAVRLVQIKSKGTVACLQVVTSNIKISSRSLRLILIGSIEMSLIGLSKS